MAAKHWLSRGFEELARRCQAGRDRKEFDFDVIIVGSGYGAAIAADHLARRGRENAAGEIEPLSIAILERGYEYLNGMFPKSSADMIAQMRFATPNGKHASGTREGLFDFRLGPDAAALVANGLGGGSLINAGVMMEPVGTVFESGWPDRIDYQQLAPHFARCKRLLGAEIFSRPLRKFDSLSRLSPEDTRRIPVTVAEAPRDGAGGCIQCGNCATGCNFGAKISLDVSLLSRAVSVNRRVEIFTGATVHRFYPFRNSAHEDGWRVEVGFTNRGLHKRYPEPTAVKARYLIIGAGTFGSTELLMRSESDTMRFSTRLGHQFSGNGDMLAATYGDTKPVEAVSESPGQFGVKHEIGPTIVGAIDKREAHGILVEEMAVPYPMKAMFEQVVTTTAALTALTRPSMATHTHGFGFRDPFSVDPGLIKRTSVLALMGDDGAAGEIHRNDHASGEGCTYISWPGYGDHPLYKRQMQLLCDLHRKSGKGGVVLANPLWQPLPPALRHLGTDEAGPLITVHPLGGCAMGNSGCNGVVDHLGRVFKRDSTDTWPNLCVLDGSIIPRSLGTNPALTIAAVARRAIRDVSVIWRLTKHAAAENVLPERPDFERIDSPSVDEPTTVTVRERMLGDVELETAAGKMPVTLELTVQTEDADIASLCDPNIRKLKIGAGSRLRVFRKNRYEPLLASSIDSTAIETRLERAALASMSVSGTLSLFPRKRTNGIGRLFRGMYAFVVNGGARDAYQRLFGSRDNKTRVHSNSNTAGLVVALATRAGEQRLMHYELTVGEDRAVREGVGLPVFRGQQVSGSKLITYSVAANPVRQMMELELEQFPGLAPGSARMLRMDPRYLARIGVPLIEVTGQQNVVRSLEGVIAVLGYVARMLVSIHAWTFRLPDAHTRPPMRRLPGPLPGMPCFEQYSLSHPGDGRKLPVKLTRYERDGAQPVLLLHGYSASGTTFAHDSLEPAAAEYFWRDGFDVWVADLRTSAGMPSAVKSWTFEDVSHEDIPCAIAHIAAVTGESVHIVAHCMGAAMFAMGVLAEDDPANPVQSAMRKHVGRVVMSQVGPGVVFSPANIFRAYMLDYIKRFLPLTRFAFRVDNRDSFAQQLLDRALNLLPYPEEEFRLENPVWPPWKRTEFTGIRHRMDILYGRDFSLANVQPNFLNAIDAQFGPLNLDTVSQVIEFARWKNITDKRGRNVYYHRERLRNSWRFDTLSIHGQDNGLSSGDTLFRNKRVLRDAGVFYQTKSFAGFGHQDTWAGRESGEKVFPAIVDFLARPPVDREVRGKRPLIAAPPFVGPVQSRHPGQPDVVLLKLGIGPNLSPPEAIVTFPVERRGDRYVAKVELDSDEGRGAMQVFGNPAFDANGMTELAIDRLPGDPDLIVLMLYDEHPALLDTTFGEKPFALHQATVCYRENEEPLRRRDAIRAALTMNASRQESAVVRTGTRNGNDLKLAFASCQFAPMVVDKHLAYASYARLGQAIARGSFCPDLVLLLGDQVYVDSTAGLFDPDRKYEKFVKPHIDLLSNDAVQSVISKVPTCMMLDDHEIVNDWENNPADPENDDERRRGESAFRSFQFNSRSGRDADGFWGEVMREPLPVFMLNTRSDREPRTLDNIEGAGIMSEPQLDAVCTWLRQCPDDKPKIITSASLPFPRHRPLEQFSQAAIRSDSVDGYPATVDRLLGYIVENRIRRVVMLSGDEHRPITARARLYDGDVEVADIVSVHTTALYSPLPFANAGAADFVTDDTFSFAQGQYRCEVKAEVHPAGEGFTQVHIRQQQGKWILSGYFAGIDLAFEFEL